MSRLWPVDRGRESVDERRPPFVAGIRPATRPAVVRERRNLDCQQRPFGFQLWQFLQEHFQPIGRDVIPVLYPAAVAVREARRDLGMLPSGCCKGSKTAGVFVSVIWAGGVA